MTPRRRRAFATLALLTPVALLAVVEGIVRLAWDDPSRPLFVAVPDDSAYVVANPLVARRYFPADERPPAPPDELLPAGDDRRPFRIVVLGESSAAGFPYPRNVVFSRTLRDALRDVLPGDSIEVVNVAIAATNSFTVLDLLPEVLARHPDAVLLYGGHNEYYGALGAASTIGGAPPAVTRAYLALQRLRSVALLRDAYARLRAGAAPRGPAADGGAVSFMETLADDQAIALDGPRYRQGLAQFESNLRLVARRCREAGVPLFVGSLASNVRDLAPFAVPENDAPGGARAAFHDARRALAAGDSAGARAGFVRARDLDVVRFRAPTALNDVVRRVAAAEGAHYVPVAEAFDSAGAGMPGSELFLEHVHPTRRGYALLARAYFDALRDRRFLGHPADPARLLSWDEYERRTTLTPLDERIAHHTTRSLVTRWPFVPIAEQTDHRGTYRPRGTVDSLALLASRGGIGWEEAKGAAAAAYAGAGHVDSALAEYRGLMRNRPRWHVPYRLAGELLLRVDRPTKAESLLARSVALRPSGEALYSLGMLALRRRDYARGVPLLERALALEPTAPQTLYQLSLAYGATQRLDAARGAALRLAQVAPNYPGLANWMALIGLGERR